MQRLLSTLAVVVALAAGGRGSSTPTYLGFNSASMNLDNSAKTQQDFVTEFTTAQSLKGAPHTFNAVRLYTNIQGYTTNTPISAFQAALATKTYILLGIWTSGTTNIDNELFALKSALSQYGQAFVDLVIGVSIGSEDLYRNSETSIINKGGIGNQPAAIVGFIHDFKTAFANTSLASIPIGHVDTWDAWTNGTNHPVIDAIDWLGVDEYPYYQNNTGNTIEHAPTLFDDAYNAVVAVAGGKSVWVTETGWPVSGPTWDQAVSSVANAKTFWDSVGCRKLFGKTPTFWYILEDSEPSNKPNFGITTNMSTTPLFNLTCPIAPEETSTSTSSVAPTPSPTSAASPTKPSATGTSGTPSTHDTTSAVSTPVTTGTPGASGTSVSASPSSTSQSGSELIHAMPAALFAGLALSGGIFCLL